MNTKKALALALRKQGKSFREIEKELNVARSTLSLWFKKLAESEQIKQRLNDNRMKAAFDRMKKVNMVRRVTLEFQYAKAVSEAKQEYMKYKNEPGFMAGLVLYLGKGDLKTKNVVALSSHHLVLHAVFHTFCIQYLKIPKKLIKIRVFCNTSDNNVKIEKQWSKLNIPQITFIYKENSEFKEVKHKKLQFSIGTSIITSTIHKKKIMQWVQCLEENNAGMV